METVKEKLMNLISGIIELYPSEYEKIATYLIQNGVTIATDTNVGDKLVKTSERENCPMRHENGNCLPAGGFCTAVNDPICDALHNAYENGRCSVATDTNDKWVSVDERLPDIGGMPVLMVAVNTFGQQAIVKGFTDYFSSSGFLTNEKEYEHIWDAWKVTHWMPLPEPPKEVE